VTPDNRARMLATLRESLRHAYLPDASSHEVDGAPFPHPSPLPASPPQHTHTTRWGPRSGERESGLDARTTPAIGGVLPAHAERGTTEALAARFCEEVEALAGVTYRTEGAEGAADHIASILARSNDTNLVSWATDEIGLVGLGAALASRGLTMVPPAVPFADGERSTSLETLARVSVGLTGAHAAIADSGSLVLVSGPGRGRLSSLLPPIHIAILHRDRIVATLSDLFRADPDLARLGSNLVIITGPSRTADIEMTLSRGVHGPGEVHVILV
jgi:L-lactate dehydrogenase complex protein LldG